MTSTLAARDQSARDRVGPEQYRITQKHRITQLEQQVEGLTRALQTRDTIGQAKGILLSRYAMGPDQAFALLVRLSQNTNTKLADIAADLVARVREYDEPGPARAAATAVVDGLVAVAGAPRGARHVEPAGSHGDQHAPGPATTPSPDRSAARSVA